jgi:uncharacterized protein
MPVLKCPNCQRTVTYTDPVEVPWRPFCSQRCKLVDLSKWLNEEYRISEELPEERTDRDLPRSEDGD